MKFNFKKIGSVLASAAMIGATAGMAVAANFPAPYSSSDYAIVIGANGADRSAAVSIGNSLGDGATTTTVVGGDMYTIETRMDALNIGESLSDVVDNLAEGDLDFLEDTDFYAGNTDIDVEQKLYLGDVAISFDSLGNEEDYVINTNLASDKLPVLHVDTSSLSIWTLNIDFSDDFDASDVDATEKVSIAGREYTFYPEMDEDEVVLYGSSQIITLADGDTETVTIDGESFTIEVIGGNIANENALIEINDKSEQVSTGEEINVEDQRFYVNRVSGLDTGELNRVQVEIFAGAERIDIGDSGDTVQVNDEDVDGVTVTWLGNSSELSELDFVFTPSELDSSTDEIDALEIGESIVDPLFGTIVMSFTGVEPELKSSDRGAIEVAAAGDDVEITLENRDNDEATLTIFTLNSTNSGVDYHEEFLTAELATQFLDNNQWFILQEGSDNSEYVSKAIEVSGNPGDEDIDLKELFSNDPAKAFDSGDEIFDTGVFVCQNETGNSSTWYLDTDTGCSTGTYGSVTGEEVLYTVDNVEVTLDDLGANGNISLIEDINTDAVQGFELSIQPDSEDEEIHVRMNVAAYGDSADDDMGYYISAWGAYAEANEDSDYPSVNIWTTVEEAEYKVMVGTGSVSTEAGSAMVMTDSQIATLQDAVDDGLNLIVVGGSCINKLAAELLGGAYCTSEFTTATGVSSGDFLIKTFAILDSDYVATLVAGYSAGDTEDAADALISETVSTDVDMEYNRADLA